MDARWRTIRSFSGAARDVVAGAETCRPILKLLTSVEGPRHRFFGGFPSETLEQRGKPDRRGARCVRHTSDLFHLKSHGLELPAGFFAGDGSADEIWYKVEGFEPRVREMIAQPDHRIMGIVQRDDGSATRNQHAVQLSKTCGDLLLVAKMIE